jgi:hypothetical protein
MVRLAQIMQLSCVKISTISIRTETSFHLSLVTEKYRQVRPKQFLSPLYVWRKPCSNLVPTLANTIYKQTETRFHMTHVTWDIRRLHPKRFPSLWYVRPKPCTYLASRLVLSPNEPKQTSTWASSHRSSTGCVQNDFWAYGTFGANHASILHQE